MFTDNIVDGPNTFEKSIYPLVTKCFLENEVFYVFVQLMIYLCNGEGFKTC